MEAIPLKASGRDLRPQCVPGRVQAVFQTSPRDAVITVRAGKNRLMLISTDPAAPGVHLAGRKPPALPSPTITAIKPRKVVFPRRQYVPV